MALGARAVFLGRHGGAVAGQASVARDDILGTGDRPQPGPAWLP